MTTLTRAQSEQAFQHLIRTVARFDLDSNNNPHIAERALATISINNVLDLSGLDFPTIATLETPEIQPSQSRRHGESHDR